MGSLWFDAIFQDDGVTAADIMVHCAFVVFFSTYPSIGNSFCMFTHL